jgi:Mg-chelatase subunit ChlI
MHLSLDLAGLPGVDLLNDAEKELCTGCRLLPVQYLSMKVQLMRESLKKGAPLNRNDVRNMFKIDPLKAIRVYELLLMHGWVLEDGVLPEEEEEPPAKVEESSEDEEEADEEEEEEDDEQEEEEEEEEEEEYVTDDEEEEEEDEEDEEDDSEED